VPPLCSRWCGALLGAWGAHPDALEEAFAEWMDTAATASALEVENEAPESDVVEELRGGWEGVVAAGAGGGADGGGEGEEAAPPSRSRHLRLAEGDGGRGSGCAGPAATLALLLVLAFSAYFAAAFGVLRGDSAARSLLGAWALGVALAAGALHPLAAAAEVAWHLLLWPRAAPALAVVPLLGAACGARQTAAELRAAALPADAAVAGRLALLLRGFAAAAATGAPPEGAVVAAAGLPRVGAALHGRAHWAAAAARGAELRGALLAARAGAPALVAAPLPAPRARAPAPPPTPPAPPTPLALTALAPPHAPPLPAPPPLALPGASPDALDGVVATVGARALAWGVPVGGARGLALPPRRVAPLRDALP
jgi:hypothetical protein